MNLKATLNEEHILTIFLEGAIDSATAPQAEEQIMEYYHAHEARAVELDAAELKYISSSGLRVLLIMHKACKGGVSLHGENEVVSEILSQTGFDSIFH